MDFFVSADVREQCLRYDVRIEKGVSAGLLVARQIGMESPVRLRRGIYDVDLIGAFTYFGVDSMFYYVESIGRFCSIASNIQAGHAEHPAHFLSPHPIFQADPAWTDSTDGFLTRNREMIDRSRMLRHAFDLQRFGKVRIGNDVWIGEGVFIRRGVEIGDGAVLGARSVVTHDVPPYAVVAGSPATIVRHRFEPAIVAALAELEWWLYGLSALEGVDFTDIGKAIDVIDRNIASGRATLYDAPVLNVGQEMVGVLHFDRETGAFSS